MNLKWLLKTYTSSLGKITELWELSKSQNNSFASHQSHTLFQILIGPLKQCILYTYHLTEAWWLFSRVHDGTCLVKWFEVELVEVATETQLKYISVCIDKMNNTWVILCAVGLWAGVAQHEDSYVCACVFEGGEEWSECALPEELRGDALPDDLWPQLKKEALTGTVLFCFDTYFPTILCRLEHSATQKAFILLWITKRTSLMLQKVPEHYH